MTGGKARFVRRYTTASGSAFMRFERDGQYIDVRARDGRGMADRYTRREAREVAEDRLDGSPAIWAVACDAYVTEPATRAASEQLLAEIELLGACSSVHRLERT